LFQAILSEQYCQYILAPLLALSQLVTELFSSCSNTGSSVYFQVMLLKLNKEGPFKKDVFRAPGHQGNMRKLIHFLQQGRLVNIHSFSVNTIASVLKKFLRKIPGGIFGVDNEAELFDIINLEDTQDKLVRVQR
jgi:hypothetical protein